MAIAFAQGDPNFGSSIPLERIHETVTLGPDGQDANGE